MITLYEFRSTTMNRMNNPPIFKKIKKLLADEGYIQQDSGDIYINGEIGTNYLAKDKSEVVHVAVNVWPDDEEIEILKGER